MSSDDVQQTKVGDTTGGADRPVRVIAGRYVLGARRGTAVEAALFEAVDREHDLPVVVKIVHPDLTADPRVREQFDAALEVAASVRHPNVSAVLDWGSAEFNGHEVLFVVYEQHSGGSLRDILDRGRLLTPSQGLVMALEVCKGLDALHKAGLVHGDVRPGTIVFDDRGVLKVTDAGLSQVVLQASGGPAGRSNDLAQYAAPETAVGADPQPRSDVYSLCLTVLEAVTGSLPFVGDSTVSTLTNRVDRLMPVSADLGALASVLERAGRPQPADRWSAGAFGRALVQAAGRMPRPEPFQYRGNDLFCPPQPQRRPAPVPASDDPIADVPTADVPAVAPLTGQAVTGGVPPVDVTVEVPLVDVMVDVPAAEAPAAGQSALDLPTGEVPSAAAETQADTLDSAVAEVPTVVPPTAAPAGSIDLSGLDLVALGIEPAPSGPAGGTSHDEGPPTGELPQLPPRTVIDPWGATLTAPDPTDPGQPSPAAWEAVRRQREAVAATRGDVYEDEYLSLRTAGRRRWLVLASVVLLAAVAGIVWFATRPDMRTVPNVAGLEQGVALNALSGDFQGIVQSEPSDDVALGLVIRSEPEQGVSLEKGSTVTLFISTGPPPRVLPDVVGMTAQEATDSLQELGLGVTQADPAFDEEVPVGVVISWSVPESPTLKAGDTVVKGTVVHLVVSAGPEPRTVPDLTGKTLSQATAALRELGLLVTMLPDEFSATVPAGSVARQDPAPNAALDRGATVSVALSKGPDLVAIPTLTGLDITRMKKALTDAGLVVGKITGNPAKEFVGITIGGAAATEGQQVPRGTTIDLTFLS